jgi:tellurite resistance protein TerC
MRLVARLYGIIGRAVSPFFIYRGPKGWVMHTDNLWLWIAFGVIIITLLVIDLGVVNRKAHTITTRQAAIWTGVWISLALLFNLAIYFWRGPQTALEFFTGYVIEYSLSVDNLFVFVILFSAFGVPQSQQHRVLFWGILGALILRGILITFGVVMIERFFWIAYIFGAFLIYSGLKIGFKKESEPHPEKNPILRLARKFLPITKRNYQGKFMMRRNGKLFFTPLVLVLIAVETTDLVFALDSVPAIFGITHDPFVIYTSNIFAIMGLRSLYFLLAKAMGKFHFLQHALSVILVFIGVKMVIAHFYEVPIGISLGVVIGLLVLAVILSLLREKQLQRQHIGQIHKP